MIEKKMVFQAISVIAACLLIVVAVVTFHRPASPTDTQSIASDSSATTTSTPTTGSSAWNNLISSIRPILKAALKKTNDSQVDFDFEQRSSISIIREVAVAGGASEALVGLGDGGASTEDVTVMRRDNDGTPFVALFKQKDVGQPSALITVHGATVTMGDAAVLLPQQDAVVVGSWNVDLSTPEQSYPANCSAVAYRWDNTQRVFIPDVALSATIHDRFCQVAKTWRGDGPFEL